MMRLTRKRLLAAIKAAGSQGDQATFTRLCVENRISYPVAMTAYRAGASFARFVAARDASLEQPQ